MRPQSKNSETMTVTSDLLVLEEFLFHCLASRHGAPCRVGLTNVLSKGDWRVRPQTVKLQQ